MSCPGTKWTGLMTSVVVFDCVSISCVSVYSPSFSVKPFPNYCSIWTSKDMSDTEHYFVEWFSWRKWSNECNWWQKYWWPFGVLKRQFCTLSRRTSHKGWQQRRWGTQRRRRRRWYFTFSVGAVFGRKRFREWMARSIRYRFLFPLYVKAEWVDFFW